MHRAEVNRVFETSLFIVTKHRSVLRECALRGIPKTVSTASQPETPFTFLTTMRAVLLHIPWRIPGAACLCRRRLPWPWPAGESPRASAPASALEPARSSPAAPAPVVDVTLTLGNCTNVPKI